MKQKNGIICLETEWEHTIERNRRSIHTKPLLDFLEKSSGCEIIYRRVATKNELQYYLKRFNLAKYDNYSIISSFIPWGYTFNLSGRRKRG